MKLHVLGNGGPRPHAAGQRFGTCCILEFGDERILLDCGPAATYKMARMGMRPTQINTVFLTHHHSDHIVDFPCFALLRFDLDPGDLAPLRLYGPPPTVEFADGLFKDKGVFRPDIIARQQHPISHHGYLKRGGTLPRPEVKVEARDLLSGDTVEGDDWKAAAVEVPHVEPWLTSLAYRIDTEEGSLLFLGDAADCPRLRELAKGVDTLVTGLVPLNFKEGDASHPIHGVSADFSEVVDIALDGGISRIVLIHGAPPGDDVVTKLARGNNGKGFQGIVVQPTELTTVEI